MNMAGNPRKTGRLSTKSAFSADIMREAGPKRFFVGIKSSFYEVRINDPERLRDWLTQFIEWRDYHAKKAEKMEIRKLSK